MDSGNSFSDSYYSTVDRNYGRGPRPEASRNAPAQTQQTSDESSSISNTVLVLSIIAIVLLVLLFLWVAITSKKLKKDVDKKPIVNNHTVGTTVAVGLGASPNKEKDDITAMGIQSLAINEGNFNTGFGSHTLANNTTGSWNTVVGDHAMAENVTGALNSAYGYKALSTNSTGFGNSAFGKDAMLDNTKGFFNNAYGTNALRSNTIGANNSSFGTSALLNNTTGLNNSAYGLSSLSANTTGLSNSGFGFGAGSKNVIGLNNTFVGAGSNRGLFDISNATALGFGSIVDASNKVRIGNVNVTAIEGQVAFTISSDRTLKEDIEPLDLSLDFLKLLEPVTYHRIGNDSPELEIGLIAQDVKEKLEQSNHPLLGLVSKSEDTGIMSIRYNDLLGPIINSIKALDEKIDAINKK